MRTALLSAVLGVSLLGCVSTIGDGEEGELIDTDGDGTPDTPAPDDDDVDPAAPAKITVTTDMPTISTELGTVTMITLDVATENFTGPVSLSASVVDGAGLAIPGWTVELAQPSMTFAGTATQSVVATLTIPTEYAGPMNAQVNIDATSSLGTQTATTAITALNQVSLQVTENAATGRCILPPQNSGVTVKVGTKVRIVNKFTSGDRIVIHGIGDIPHEGNEGTAVDDAYEVMLTTPGSGNWWCHAPSTQYPGNATNPAITWVE